MQSSNKKKKLWIEEKERLLKMTLEERRKEYKDYVSLDKIPSLKEELKSKASNNDENSEQEQVKSSLCEKVSLYKGDITQLEVDAIVNAANSSLLGGGGVDGCIHRASGPYLFAECRTLHGCRTGEAKITCGYELPARYVIHTVGPIARGQLNESHKADLASCYQSSLKLAKEHQIRTIAFPCISTGIYGFPNEPAAIIALNKCKEWLKKNHDEMDRIIFCVFLDVDFKIYKKKLVDVFVKDDEDVGDEEDEDIKEGTEQMNEDTEVMTQKAQSPPIKKYKGKQPESLPDPSEDDQEEKDTVSAGGMKEEIQEADEKNQSFPPVIPEKEIGLPPEKNTDGSKDKVKEEECPADQEMSDKKNSEEQGYSQENKADNPTDITMDSQADSQEDDTNAESTSCPPVDAVGDPINTISMIDDDKDLCQEKATESSNIDVEMSSQNLADPNGGIEEKQMKED